MEAKELRIGNLLCKDNGEIFTVKRLDETKDILVKEQNGLLTLGYNLFGIPLTEEWLLKFGFEQNGDVFEYSEDRYWTINNYEHGFYFDLGNIEIKIDYVHSLQNLYFALTGQELTIKEI